MMEAFIDFCEANPCQQILAGPQRSGLETITASVFYRNKGIQSAAVAFQPTIKLIRE
jgi:hypothetical protein